MYFALLWDGMRRQAMKCLNKMRPASVNRCTAGPQMSKPLFNFSAKRCPESSDVMAIVPMTVETQAVPATEATYVHRRVV